MSLSYAAIEGKSRGYKLLVAVLGILAILGIASFMVSYIKGHQVFGSSNVIPWGMPIVLTIYLIGLSAGLHILAFLIYITGKEQYRPVIRLAVFVAVVLIFGAMLSIATDLGRPEKFWRLFMLFYLNNMSSMFAINAIFYTAYFISASTYLVSLLAEAKRFSVIMGMVAFGWAVLVVAADGAIFGFIATRETWFSPLSPFEFIFAAFTSSLALLILLLVLVFRFSRRQFSGELITSLGNLVAIFLVILLLLMLVGELTHTYAPDRAPTIFMLFGPFSWMFWGLQILLGSFVPLAILFHPKAKRSTGWVVAASALVVLGVFVKRYYLVIVGAAYPLPYYPGKIEGVWGQVGSFPLKPLETIMSLGIFALLGLIFVLGLKYLELLPARETSQPQPAPSDSGGKK